MAAKLHTRQSRRIEPPRSALAAHPADPMNKEFKTRFTVILLGLVTVGVATLGWINFQKEPDFQLPYDGVWWVERAGHQVAVRLDPNGPGSQAGIKSGDLLTSINQREIRTAAERVRLTFQTGIYQKATYSLVRQGVPVDVEVVLGAADRSLNRWQRWIALIYLGIGLYVLLRRWTAPGSLHFYIFCLTSFVLYSFKYTGKLNDFDWVIYWGNVVAGLLQPALFLHFVLTFPEKRTVVKKHPWVVPVIYIPGALLLGLHIVVMRMVRASEELRWNVDRLEMLYLATFFVAAAAVLWHSYRRASTPILRQQLKWVTRGTILAITPFTLFYVIPYLSGQMPTIAMKVSVLSLGLLPLTFGYAIFRYRLMDVDLIFKRGMAYTLAAASVVGIYFALVAAVAETVHTRIPSSGPIGLMLAVTITALLFDPVRKYIQETIDQFFYRTRYDYRRTLVEFGRELSGETDLDKMLSSVVDRLSRTLLVDRMAIFLVTGENAQNWVLAKSFGLARTGGLDFNFLNAQRPENEAGHLFFENTHMVPREAPAAQEAIAQLDLNYYIPCRARQKTIAFLGLGKTVEGDFLSSEDVELLETLAGYIAIAIQNGRLYASLEQKVSEYERLKDFNENIVESINVGVMAVDLADRIESWNSQMEVMYALPRWQALTRPLSEIFPAPFVEEFYRVRQNAGIHNLYKFRLATPTGETRTVNVAIAPLVTKKFHVIGRLIIMDDITERVELESQLSQADKLSSIGLLAAGVAHEVNTPLAVISSYAQMLQKQLQGDEKKSGLLEKITRQTFRASEIVNNLLNFSRTSGTEFTDVNINKVISDTLALLEHQFRVSKVRVEDDLYNDLPTIQGNPGRLQQVFLNLFLNAKDAMPEGGTLRIATSNGEHVSVRVADTGSGIAQEHIHRIYDPFFTTKANSQQGQNRGTGLGLSVTYGIIQEHAGKIRVESRPGQGTTFHLDFPLARKTVNV
ncbi:MAG TPA: ATP-binding protein [Terriglobales bacterium]|jgi:two-component system, NtrC family, sensor kinase|nr:ATP-binding protein [Terriglobales bacterium]